VSELEGRTFLVTGGNTGIGRATAAGLAGRGGRVWIAARSRAKGEAAVAAGLVASGDGLAGSSFVAVQRWAHDLRVFHGHTPPQCDDMIGRRRDTNEEMPDAPATSHVKRSTQESYDPPAFMVRRSMPWATTAGQGLEFIAYGHSLDAFERMLRRMCGLEDGIVDALFVFSRPTTGGYYWCPPLKNDGRLDLRILGL